MSLWGIVGIFFFFLWKPIELKIHFYGQPPFSFALKSIQFNIECNETVFQNQPQIAIAWDETTIFVQNQLSVLDGDSWPLILSSLFFLITDFWSLYKGLSLHPHHKQQTHTLSFLSLSLFRVLYFVKDLSYKVLITSFWVFDRGVLRYSAKIERTVTVLSWEKLRCTRCTADTRYIFSSRQAVILRFG